MNTKRPMKLVSLTGVFVLLLFFAGGYLAATARFYDACIADKFTIHLCKQTVREVWALPL